MRTALAGTTPAPSPPALPPLFAVCTCTPDTVCDICLDELGDEAGRLLAAHNVGSYQAAAVRVTRTGRDHAARTGR